METPTDKDRIITDLRAKLAACEKANEQLEESWKFAEKQYNDNLAAALARYWESSATVALRAAADACRLAADAKEGKL